MDSLFNPEFKIREVAERIRATRESVGLSPEEMAEVYVLLATTPIITGTVITVDGGYSLLNR